MNWRPDQPEQAHGAATLTCPLKIDSRTLSDWRDGQLNQAAAERVRAHIAHDDCAACQAHLADYDAIGDFLRMQRVPRASALDMESLRPTLLNGDEGRSLLRLLPFRGGAPLEAPANATHAEDAGDNLEPADRPLATRTAPSSATQTPIPLGKRTPRSLVNQRRKRLWRGISASVAAALIVFALAQLLLHAAAIRSLVGSHTAHKGTPSVVKSATAQTYHSVQQIVWRGATLPPGFAPDQYSTNTFAVAPSDGDTAYTCYPTGAPAQTAPQFWVTHDAHTWSQLTTFPSAAHGWCAITVDESDPNRMVVGLSYPGPPDTATNAPDSYFATEDGGRSWRRITGLGDTDLLSLATVGGAYYALLQPEPFSADVSVGNRLMVSRDGMRTWIYADTGLIGGTDTQILQQVWANPFTNELVALTEANGGAFQQYLWESRNGANSWRLVSHIANAQYVMQQPTAGHAWAFCAYDHSPTPNDPTRPDQVICSPLDTDAPSVRPGIGVTFTSTEGQPVFAGQLIGLTTHGDLLMIGQGTNPLKSAKINEIYRLPAGSSTWQDLGARFVPQQLVLYAPTASGGEVLWEIPTADDSTGSIYLATYSTP